MLFHRDNLTTYRCPNCRHIVFRGILVVGSAVEIKCHCNQLTRVVCTAPSAVLVESVQAPTRNR